MSNIKCPAARHSNVECRVARHLNVKCLIARHSNVQCQMFSQLHAAASFPILFLISECRQCFKHFLVYEPLLIWPFCSFYRPKHNDTRDGSTSECVFHC